MVFQQGRRESGDRGVRFSPAHPELPRQLLHRWVRRKDTGDRERRWEPFSTSDYSTVTLLAKFRG